MSTFSSTLQLLYLLSSQMFMLHSKCGSRLTSSVLRLTRPLFLRGHRAPLPALAAHDVLRRLAACALALLAGRLRQRTRRVRERVRERNGWHGVDGERRQTHLLRRRVQVRQKGRRETDRRRLGGLARLCRRLARTRLLGNRCALRLRWEKGREETCAAGDLISSLCVKRMSRRGTGVPCRLCSKSDHARR